MKEIPANLANSAAIGPVRFFVATSAEEGYALWKTDGSEAGTVLVKDLEPGAFGSSPTGLVAVGYSTGNGVSALE